MMAADSTAAFMLPLPRDDRETTSPAAQDEKLLHYTCNLPPIAASPYETPMPNFGSDLNHGCTKHLAPTLAVIEPGQYKTKSWFRVETARFPNMILCRHAPAPELNNSNIARPYHKGGFKGTLWGGGGGVCGCIIW